MYVNMLYTDLYVFDQFCKHAHNSCDYMWSSYYSMMLRPFSSCVLYVAMYTCVDVVHVLYSTKSSRAKTLWILWFLFELRMFSCEFQSVLVLVVIILMQM